MQYIMAPLEAHYDDGFGAVGEAFKEGAEILAKESGGRRIFWNHLPELFPATPRHRAISKVRNHRYAS